MSDEATDHGAVTGAEVQQVDRPDMPDGYGVPAHSEGLLAWHEIERRLVTSRVYWMVTTRPDGRPHVVPRWGVWVDGGLYYDGSPETRHARNLRGNDACVLHLEDGTQAVIVEGRSGPSASPASELALRIAAAIGSKYADDGYAPEPDAWDGPHAGGLCRFTPDKALAWRQFPTDVTRFRF